MTLFRHGWTLSLRGEDWSTNPAWIFREFWCFGLRGMGTEKTSSTPSNYRTTAFSSIPSRAPCSCRRRRRPPEIADMAFGAPRRKYAGGASSHARLNNVCKMANSSGVPIVSLEENPLGFFCFAIKYKNAIIFLHWPYRLTVRTSPFQGGNQSSILCRVTSEEAWLSG